MVSPLTPAFTTAVLAPFTSNPLLKQCRVGLLGSKPWARRQAVAERHDHRRGLAWRGRTCLLCMPAAATNGESARLQSIACDKCFARAMPCAALGSAGTLDARRKPLCNCAWLACCCVPTAAAAAIAQTPANPDPAQPDFRVVVQGTFDPETLAEFNRRVQDYAALRSRMEARITSSRRNDQERRRYQEVASTVSQSGFAMHAAPRRGQLFVPAMEGQVKRMLVVQANPAMVAAIMDDGPGEFDVDVNDTYLKKYPLATMPPKLLLLLPDLPNGSPVPVRGPSFDSVRRARQHHR